MSLPTNFLDELRARTQISAVIGRQVKLLRAGREWKACCPFHSEKTPSFTVNDEKGFYHCFGCGAHGDAIRFLTDARGLPFMEAVKELAESAGMEVPAPDPRAQEKAARAAGLHVVMEAAATWFEEQLAGIDGAQARAYLEKRGISAATQRRFRLGYAPDSRGRLKAALRQFGVDQLLEAGLLVEPEGGKEPYDRFRGRLVFPIRDARGRVIAFGGRILGEGEPKYLNSPDTPLFDKGRTLYNLDLAAAAARTAGRTLVVEGYMDVIALDQAGIGEAVAPLGTALTEAQLDRLWRLVPVPLLCFDGDAAGEKAAMRAATRALPQVRPGRSLAFVTLPAGQDPDDLVRSQGREAMEALIGRAEPLVDRIWRHEVAAETLGTPEQQAGLRRRLLDHASSVQDSDVRDLYRAELLRRFAALGRPQERAWRGGERGYAPRRSASSRARAVGAGGLVANNAAAVLQGLLRFPELIGSHAETIAALPLERGAAKLRDEMLDAALRHGNLDPEQLNAILADKSAASLLEELRQQQGLAFSFTRRDADPERAQRDLVLVLETLAARPELEAALEAATRRLKEKGDDAAYLEQQRLRQARDEADRQLAALVERAVG